MRISAAQEHPEESRCVCAPGNENFKNTPFHSTNERSYFPESLLALAPKQPLTTFANLMAVK